MFLGKWEWSPTGKARGTSMFFGGIRRSIPSYAQGFGGLSSPYSSTAIGRGLLRRRIKVLRFSDRDVFENIGGVMEGIWSCL